MLRDPLTGETFARVVGKRARPPHGDPPSAERRAALATLQGAGAGGPNGIFIYRSHEEMDADRLRWTLAAIAATAATTTPEADG